MPLPLLVEAKEIQQRIDESYPRMLALNEAHKDQVDYEFLKGGNKILRVASNELLAGGRT